MTRARCQEDSPGCAGLSGKVCSNGIFLNWVRSLGFVQAGQEEEEALQMRRCRRPSLALVSKDCLPLKGTAFGAVFGFGFLCPCQAFGNIGKEDVGQISVPPS